MDLVGLMSYIDFGPLLGANFLFYLKNRYFLNYEYIAKNNFISFLSSIQK